MISGWTMYKNMFSYLVSTQCVGQSADKMSSNVHSPMITFVYTCCVDNFPFFLLLAYILLRVLFIITDTIIVTTLDFKHFREKIWFETLKRKYSCGMANTKNVNETWQVERAIYTHRERKEKKNAGIPGLSLKVVREWWSLAVVLQV